MRYIFFLACVAAFASCKKPVETRTAETSDSLKERLPLIDVFVTTGDTVRMNALQGRNVLIFFTPDCDHCQREAADIHNHLDLFKDYTLYFVASQSLEVVRDFAVKYGIDNKPNIVLARAEIIPVVTQLKPTSMPTILIYDERGFLVKRFDGETKVEDIAEFL
jgi:thioredoxin-related protein